MLKSLKYAGMSIIALAVTTILFAQPPQKQDSTKTTGPGPGAQRPATGPKPYKEIITDKAVTRKGMFTIHKLDDKYYFELPKNTLGRDILVVNRVSKSSVESPKAFFGYSGDQIANNVIRFEKGPNNKIFLKTISF